VTRQWLRPDDLRQATGAIRAGATPVGGGAALASRAFAPRINEVAVDLAGLNLGGLSPPRIGALVTIEQLANDPQVAIGWPAVAEAAHLTANPGVRRVATVGGTVAVRLASGDLPTALCAYGSMVETTKDGMFFHIRPVDDYLRSEPDRAIVTAVILGPPGRGTYRRLAGRPGPAPAIAAIAAVRVGAAVQCWCGAVSRSPRPYDSADPPLEADLLDDDRASAWYRRRVLAVLAAEALGALND
jgi:CO/xanthine dehydrogenase FAD-binding subunit